MGGQTQGRQHRRRLKRQDQAASGLQPDQEELFVIS